MAYEFALPDIGEGLTEADIVRWLVDVGDEVAVDEILVEVETAKAVVEMPSPAAGVVLHRGGQVGETLQVGAILAVIGESGEEWSVDDVGAGDAPIVGSLSTEAEDLPARVSGVSPKPARVQALPLVRRLAREHGVDLTTLVGSGRDGRITRDDVLAAVATADEPIESSVNESATSPRSGSDRVRMSMLRRTIAQHMEQSWREIPHVTTFDEVDASRLLTARKALAARHGQPMPIEALVIKAVLPALAAFREFNASLDGDEIILHGDHHIGIAVDTEDGLLVPVIHDASARGLLQIAKAVEDLGGRGKTRSLTTDELSGATFTVSNIGAVGGTHGTPIIPLGTTAILSVGRASDRAIARDGAVVIAPMMPLSLSFDHRVIDGGMGRRFMAMLIENLEEPALFLAD